MMTARPAAAPVDVSAIVPTIGRPKSLAKLLASLAAQTVPIQEVIVADAGGGEEIEHLTREPCWNDAGLAVHCIAVSPPNAVRQRTEAINFSKSKFLLLLDDDVVLEPTCVGRMLDSIQSAPDVVGVVADFNNESWPQ